MKKKGKTKRKWEISHGLQDGVPTTTESLSLTKKEGKSMSDALGINWKNIHKMFKESEKAERKGKVKFGCLKCGTEFISRKEVEKHLKICKK